MYITTLVAHVRPILANPFSRMLIDVISYHLSNFESKFPEVTTADFLADPKVRADHQHSGRRGDTMPRGMDVGPRGVSTTTGGPFRRVLLIAIGATAKLLLAAIPAVSLLHPYTLLSDADRDLVTR